MAAEGYTEVASVEMHHPPGMPHKARRVIADPIYARLLPDESVRHLFLCLMKPIP